MTILEALAWGTEKIRETIHEKKTNVHIPTHDAQILLMDVLKVRKSYLFAHGDQELTPEEWLKYHNTVLRRKAHEPVSHILQSSDFYGRSFFINQHVLTPRPETEELITLALKYATWADCFIDIGTGSGAIAITLSLETGKPIYASDIDIHALDIARQNATNLHTSRITWTHGSILQPLIPLIQNNKHIVIVANLPYLPKKSIQEMDPDVSLFEPHHALFSGLDGLDIYEQLLHESKQINSLIMLLELTPDNIHTFKTMVQKEYPHAMIQIHKDMSQKDRFIEIQI